jgi:N-acetylmuramoyl-L-alanine amidase CwlD
MLSILNKKLALFSLTSLSFSLLLSLNALAQTGKLYDVEYDSISKSIIIKSSKEVKTSVFNLDKPDRTVVDLVNAVYAPVTKRIDVNDGIVKVIKVSQYRSISKEIDAPPPVTRVSIETEGKNNFDISNINDDDIQFTRLNSLKTSSKPIVINKESLEKIYGNKKNKAELIEYQKGKIIISGLSKISYELTKEEDNTYTLRINDFSFNNVKDIPVKADTNIKSISVKEKSGDALLKIKAKPAHKLNVSLSVSNKLEISATEDSQVTIPSSKPKEINDIGTPPTNHNMLAIGLDESGKNSNVYITSEKKGLKYKIFQLNDPDRIVIDTFGTNIENFKDPFSGKYSKLIQRVRFGYLDKTESQSEGIRIVMEMKKKVIVKDSLKLDKIVELNIEEDQSSNNNTVAVAPSTSPVPQPSSSVLQPLPAYQVPDIMADSKVIIVIDAGHGGNDPGAIGVGSIKEKDVTLSVSYYVRKMLIDSGYSVLMARADDSEVLLQPRVDVANNNKADLFVSIHCNAMDNASPRGIETYYRTPQSEQFAKYIHKNMIDTLGVPDRGVRLRNLFVTRKTYMPSVLLEIGYITNPTEGANLATVDYQKKVAKAIYKGIKEYLGKQIKL